MEPQTITHEERKRLDRQRFIGWETQRKLLNSRVLITPANGPNTQLAKNLILAGVNVTLYDDAVVTQDDFESNFLIAESDIGRNRSEAVFQKLKEMNPTGKNEVFNENLLNNLDKHTEAEFSKYTMIATSTGNFDLAAKWDQFSKLCCGLYAFVFISLGKDYQYREINKADNTIAKLWTIKSLTINEAIDYPKADKNKSFIAGIQMISESQKKGIVYDPFSSSDEILQKIVEIGITLVGQKQRQFLTAFAKTYNIDYCPVYSVIGSIISQEVIKVVENQSEPGVNWLVFNSEQGYGNIVKLSPQKPLITHQVPTKQESK